MVISAASLFTVSSLPVAACFRRRSASYQPSFGAGNLQQRQDYVQVQPCTGATNYYAAAGFSLSGASTLRNCTCSVYCVVV